MMKTAGNLVATMLLQGNQVNKVMIYGMAENYESSLLIQ